jgi:hypothetical protein
VVRTRAYDTQFYAEIGANWDDLPPETLLQAAAIAKSDLGL